MAAGDLVQVIPLMTPKAVLVDLGLSGETLVEPEHIQVQGLSLIHI